MSADQWQLTLRQLYATADALEAGSNPVAPAEHAPAPDAVPEPAVVACDPDPDVVVARRSTVRLLVSSAVHSALTVGVLLAGFALVDPILPHPDRPHLADPEVAVDPGTDADGAIPQSGTYRP